MWVKAQVALVTQEYCSLLGSLPEAAPNPTLPSWSLLCVVETKRLLKGGVRAPSGASPVWSADAGLFKQKPHLGNHLVIVTCFQICAIS